MSTRKSKSQKLSVATAWPNDNLSDEEFVRWVETHSLEKLIGTAERVLPEPSSRTILEETKRKREVFERLLLALGLSREDLKAARHIARKKGTPYTTLLRAWIREGLRREQQRAAG